jgi:hypothetical protein
MKYNHHQDKCQQTEKSENSLDNNICLKCPLRRHGLSIIQLLSNTFVYWFSINRQLEVVGRDRMVAGFTTTYAISAYHH